MISDTLIQVGIAFVAPLLGGKRGLAPIVDKTRSAALLFLAGLSLMAATGMACAALWQAAAPVWGSAVASLTVSGALIALALVFWLIQILLARRTRAVPVAPTADPMEALTTALTGLVGEQKAAALLASVLAGAAAGRAMRRD
ncbi:MAG: hypothetical protein WCI94_00805 [Rhodospirillales bacterium]